MARAEIVLSDQAASQFLLDVGEGATHPTHIMRHVETVELNRSLLFMLRSLLCMRLLHALACCGSLILRVADFAVCGSLISMAR